MKSSFRSRIFLSLGAAVAFACLAVVADVVTPHAALAIGVIAMTGWGFAKLLGDGLTQVPKEKASTLVHLVPVKKLVAAVAFQLRLNRRPKPVVTPNWRMCPSV